MSGTASSRTLSESAAYCWDILPHVSRTFALTIPVLREPLRTHVGVSYLFCRIADTVEDTAGLTSDARQGLFHALSVLARSPEDARERTRLQTLWRPHPDPHHENLMRNADTVLDVFAAFPDPVREPITSCVQEMVLGMATYPSPQAGPLPAAVCSDLETLETYCHYVAGTVGRLLSRLFALELGPEWMTAGRLELGRRFGLGLQLTNVLKDHKADRERGITYIPAQWMDGGTPAALTGDGVRILVARALDHLADANSYVLSLPSQRTDLRVFCLWAFHLALATLRVVAETGGAGRAKVGRDELWRILDAARDAAGDDGRLRELHRVMDADVRRLAGIPARSPA